MKKDCKLTNVSKKNPRYHGSTRRRVRVGSCIRALKSGICIEVSKVDVYRYRYPGEVSWNPDPKSWSSNIVLLAEKIIFPEEKVAKVAEPIKEKKETDGISEDIENDMDLDEEIYKETVIEPADVSDESANIPDEEAETKQMCLEDFKELHSLKEIRKMKLDHGFSIPGWNSMSKEQKAEAIYGLLNK